MVDRRSADAIFDTKADAPASKNAWLASGSFIAVNVITLISGFMRAISRHASSEWMFGRFTSSTITSGSSRSAGLQRSAAVCDASHDLAVQCQQPAEGFQHFCVVIHQQDAGAPGQYGSPFGLSNRRATGWWRSGCYLGQACRGTRRSYSVASALCVTVSCEVVTMTAGAGPAARSRCCGSQPAARQVLPIGFGDRTVAMPKAIPSRRLSYPLPPLPTTAHRQTRPPAGTPRVSGASTPGPYQSISCPPCISPLEPANSTSSPLIVWNGHHACFRSRIASVVACPDSNQVAATIAVGALT